MVRCCQARSSIPPLRPPAHSCIGMPANVRAFLLAAAVPGSCYSLTCAHPAADGRAAGACTSAWPGRPRPHSFAPPCCAPAPACRHFTGDPVTAQPDVTELALHDDDEFVIVASDGLWDVMDSQEVTKLARRDLQRGSHPQVGGGGGNGGPGWRAAQGSGCGRTARVPVGGLRGPWARHAAAGSSAHPAVVAVCEWTCCACARAALRWPRLQEVAAKLSALAVKRGSQDNIAVVLIDLGKVDWSQQSSGGGLFGSLGGLFGSRG